MHLLKTARQQQGLSMPAIMLFIVIGVFLLTVVVRVVPAYINDFMLNQIISQMEESRPYQQAENVGDVRELLRKRVQMENIDGVDVREMKMERDENILTIGFSYEVRSPFMGNIDTVIQFNHQHELRMP